MCIDKSTLSESGVCRYVNGKKIIYKDEAVSTNTTLKELAAKDEMEGTVLITEHQTGGKGRLGKQFFSPKNCGIYFSMLLRPKIKASDAVWITVAAAVSVVRAIDNLLSVKTQIKWVNDIYFGGKKLCGILTESACDTKTGTLKYAVLGIGINLKTPACGYPDAFSDRTTNLSEMTDVFPEDFKNRFVSEIIMQFDALYENLTEKSYLAEYKNASCMLGKRIEILSGNYKGFATAEDIDENANLVVSLPDGKRVCLSSGDVSILL